MLAKTWDRLPSGNDVITEELYCWGRKVKYGGDPNICLLSKMFK